jgi:hypothetical protein
MSQVGRISGPLLTANLERNGVNLAFRNTSSDTQLLFLDVNSGKIGVNKGVAGYEFDVNGTSRSSNLLSTTSTIANYTIEGNNLTVLVGDINLVASEAIKLSALGTDNINIDDNIISSFNSNSNIDLIPNGTGKIDVFSNLEVYGNLHSNQNITLDGTITFGDTISQDTIEFNTDVNSDINPDSNDTYQIGSIDKRWSTLYTNLVNGTGVSANALSISGLDYNLKLGNIFYVSVNGDDTNSGDSKFSPFATVKRALAAADASTAGPVTIQIYPGEYQEQLPLTVPSNVTVQGVDMRNTIIVPDTSSQSEDVFLLNGESTVQNLTIKDFYAPGYAFSFAPNTVVSTRSPYVQNVTVITKGTTTSASDPRGFASRDAGGGAYIDGADVESVSQEASMLFHSVTFITPGVDAITATNGVRIECLNCFIYFASKGLYAFDGVDGHLSTDGSTVKYGAEIRSIGSANIYGEYGVVADGVDTLICLINHNMAYIGTGKYVDNDASRVIQTQEVTELNSGTIYYQTIDQYGNYRVGDQFFVNQESGETSLVINEAQVDALNGLTITTNGNITLINGTQAKTGNIRLDNNAISSILADINISAASGIINLNSSTIVHKNLDITGDLSFGGNLNLLGNQTTDIIDFNVNFDQNINPNQDGTFNLGSAAKEWVYTNANRANLGDVEFTQNYITTTVSNADLELRASGVSEIILPNNDLEIDNILEVNGITDLQDLNTNSFVIANNLNISQNFNTTNLTVGNLTVGSQAQFEEINIDGNIITTTTSNADLELRASGTGTVLIPNNNTYIYNDLTVDTLNAATININNTFAIENLNSSSDIEIFDNVIRTTNSNSNLELRAAGTGSVFLQQTYFNTSTIGTISTSLNFDVTENLNIIGTGALKIPSGTTAQRVVSSDTFIDGGDALIVGLPLDGGNALTILGSSDIIYNSGAAILSTSGNVGDIRFNTSTNLFEGTSSDSTAFGGGYSTNRLTSLTAHPTNNTLIFTVNNLQVGTVNSDGIELNRLQVDDILINSSTITTNVSNSDLEFGADGLGNILIDDFKFDTNVITNTNASNENFKFRGTNTHVVIFAGNHAVKFPAGTTAQRPASPQLGLTRQNTDLDVLETWDGTQWIPSAGLAENVSDAQMQDISLQQTLIYG